MFEALQQELAASHLLFGAPGTPAAAAAPAGHEKWQLHSYVGPDEEGMRAWVERHPIVCAGSSVPRERRGHGEVLQLTAAGEPAAWALRLVISDGPRILGSIIALRDSEFSARESAVLESGASPLVAQLLRERATELAYTGRGIAQGLLESFAEPALVFASAGWVEFCNEPADNWLSAEDRASELRELREALHARAASPHWVITSLDAFCPGLALARWRGNARNAPSQVVGLARQAWKLGELQLQVLERVANGESNKEIAKALKRAEVTIERHLTRLFRASGSRCRTELITKLFTLAP